MKKENRYFIIKQTPIYVLIVVTNACAVNKISLLIPCHRVIKSNGNLAKYRWKLKTNIIEFRK